MLLVSQRYPLPIKQPALAIQSSRETGEFSPGTNDPVAWDDERDWVAADCPADGSHRPGAINGVCNGPVTRCCAIGDRFEGTPHELLKGSSC